MRFAGLSFRFTLIFILLCSCGWLQACVSTEKNIDRATSHNYRIGHPEVKARAAGFFDEAGSPVIDLSLEIPIESLIIKRTGEKPEAGFRVSIDISDADDEIPVSSYTEEVMLEVEPGSEVRSHIYEHRLKAEPGDHRLQIRVTDLNSDKMTPVTLFVTVPDPESDTPAVSDIRMMLSGELDNQVISSFLVPSASDSISFQFFVTRNEAEAPAEVVMKLLQFRSDTEPPRALAMMPVTSGSMAYRGIDYNDQTEIQSQSRILETETGSILVDYTFSLPERGTYRFEVTVNTPDAQDEDQQFTTYRDFGVVNRHFPNVKSTQEMIGPLAYLMTPREFRRISAIQAPDSLRRAFDSFWLSNVGSRSKARDVIELYYSRVEEANRRFSNFKEGWMTDMGMVYILLGPPVAVENHIDSLIWFYSYNRYDPATVYRFERARVHSAGFPFRHYILFRHRMYQQVEFQAIQNWLTGDVLTRGIFN